MLTRRNFIESAAVISGAALSGVVLADQVNSVSARTGYLIYNTRFAHAQQFAQHFIAQGVRGVGVGSGDLGNSDLGTVWFGELRASCVQCSGKPSIVGMGMHTDFFVMQSLARDVGLTTRFYAEHRRVQSAWQHQVKQNDWLTSTVELSVGDDWVDSLSDALMPSSTRASVSETQSRIMNGHEPRLLVSWVLG